MDNSSLYSDKEHVVNFPLVLSAVGIVSFTNSYECYKKFGISNVIQNVFAKFINEASSKFAVT
jgi:hypothetical protein